MSMTAAETKPPTHVVSPKGMLIGGKWVEARSGNRIAVENPAKRATAAARCSARSPSTRLIALLDEGLKRATCPVYAFHLLTAARQTARHVRGAIALDQISLSCMTNSNM